MDRFRVNWNSLVQAGGGGQTRQEGGNAGGWGARCGNQVCPDEQPCISTLV